MAPAARHFFARRSLSCSNWPHQTKVLAYASLFREGIAHQTIICEICRQFWKARSSTLVLFHWILPVIGSLTLNMVSRPSTVGKQDHHRNGDQIARRLHILCSICVSSFGAWRQSNLRMSMASLQSQPMCSQTCSRPIDIFIDLQPFGCDSKAGLFDPQFGGLAGTSGFRDRPIR